MKVTVVGLWHLGCVTAACCAKHFDVAGLDFDPENIARLKSGKAPLFEPGLDELIQSGLEGKRLRFSGDVEESCREAEILWVTFDTPVDENDIADADFVLDAVRRCVPALPEGALVLLSSQLPVGSCAALEKEFGGRGYRFASSPENLRLGTAISTFENADRIVAGCRGERSRNQLEKLLSPFTREILWMRPESAEMTKHSINSFLALSITFMNEVARLCEVTGADAKEVERGLKSESRIGPKACLSPGGAFAGGTLARDVVTLGDLGAKHGQELAVIPAIKRSNDAHRLWALRKVREAFEGGTKGRVALLGLTYKPGTNTLRRSSAVELAMALAEDGFEVSACDPSSPELPPELSFISFSESPAAALDGADAVVVCTEWPEFREFDWRALDSGLRRSLIIDATRFLESAVADLPNLEYVSVGSPAK